MAKEQGMVLLHNRAYTSLSETSRFVNRRMCPTSDFCRGRNGIPPAVINTGSRELGEEMQPSYFINIDTSNYGA